MLHIIKGFDSSKQFELELAFRFRNEAFVEEAGWENLRQKQTAMNDYLWFVLGDVNRSAQQEVIKFITPMDQDETSCQVSMLTLKRGKEIFEELGRQGVMVDWREPNVIRIAPVPLYNTFEDVWRFGNILRSILNE